MEQRNKSKYLIDHKRILENITKTLSYEGSYSIKDLTNIEFQIKIALMSKTMNSTSKMRAYECLFNILTINNSTIEKDDYYILYKLITLLKKQEEGIALLSYTENKLRNHYAPSLCDSSSLSSLTQAQAQVQGNKPSMTHSSLDKEVNDIEDIVATQSYLISKCRQDEMKFDLGNIVLGKVLTSNENYYSYNTNKRINLLNSFIKNSKIRINTPIIQRSIVNELMHECIRKNEDSTFPDSVDQGQSQGAKKNYSVIKDMWKDESNDEYYLQYRISQSNEETEEEEDDIVFDTPFGYEVYENEENETEEGDSSMSMIEIHSKKEITSEPILISNPVSIPTPIEIPTIRIKTLILCNKLLRIENKKLLRLRTLKVNPQTTFTELREIVFNLLEIYSDAHVKSRKQMHIYKFEKKNKELLAEIIIAYSNRIPFFQVYCKEVIDDDQFNICSFLPYYIVIEINDSFLQKNFIRVPPFDKCAKCLKDLSIPIKCSYCSYNYYCSNKCLSIDNKHLAYHFNYNTFFSLIQNNQMVPIPKNQSIISSNMQLPNGKVGLKSIKNASFINSVIQCLSNTTDLRYYFICKQHEQDLNPSLPQSQRSIVMQLNLLMQKLWVDAKIDSSISAEDLGLAFYAEYPNMAMEEFKDSFFFLTTLLEELHWKLKRGKGDNKQNSSGSINDDNDDTNENSNDNKDIKPQELDVYHQAIREFNVQLKSDNSIITDVFKGQYTTLITCSICSHMRHNFEGFQFVQLSIPKKRLIVSFYFVLLSNRVESFKIVLFSKTKVKAYKELIAKDYPLLTPEVVEAVLLSPEGNIESLIEDEFIVWHIYNAKKSIIFYQKQPNEQRSLYYYAKKTETNDYSLPYRLSIDDDSMRIYKCLEIIKDNCKTLAADPSKWSFKIKHYNKKVLCDYCGKSGLNCEILNKLQTIQELLNKGKGLYFFMLEIEMPNYIRGIVPNTVIKGIEDAISLSECFDYFHSYETIKNLDCPNCQVQREVEKKIKISVFPKVLIVQLIRMKNSKTLLGTYKSTRIDSSIQIPIKGLDLKDYGMSKNVSSVYDLYAVVNQDSNKHCNCICLNEGKWTCYNDETVSGLPDNLNLNSKDAYLLFYRNVNSYWA